MMQDGEHHDGVEVARGTGEEGVGLAVLPAGGGGWVGEIDAEGKDVLAGALERGAEAIDGLHVGVDGDDFGAGVGGEHGVDAGVAAYVEDAGRLSDGEGVADEVALGGVVFRGVVVGGVDVVRPGGGTLRGCDAAHAGAQAGEGLEQDLAGDLGVCQGARHREWHRIQGWRLWELAGRGGWAG